MFGLVARLVHQKGIDLVLSAADEIIEAGGQIVVTGSGEPALEQALVDAHRRRPDAIGVSIGFNDAQARRIFAGSDFTLMPSRFEPCGLSQMYAQRFGSLPIGHQTGGLAETITDGETGFLFAQPSTESFLGGVRRAFDDVQGEGPARHHAPQRDGAVVQLEIFGGLLQRAVQEAGGGVRLSASLLRHCERSEATKQSASPRRQSGLLRCARNDDVERVRANSIARHPRAENLTPSRAHPFAAARSRRG